ncbi:cbb3-type cytochrome c oxidase subunit I [Sulfuriroseicoccus oceanibius]|uniref:Cbb3-type cytochrome c oxidase subunit I n=1 Tax=Sulfuriroseicoccus oceanibius TaxID=2707525 RepID=A0A6B3L8P9_9BACT|nr:cbb3-type cytochrome c oxidase subunit I [Sulfuriroseicoccus oceanibius]QQL44634.1 cbb3-type cytochrome c oxidase subunit I [Sulfuriroseicoccus oceanibius]
MSSSIASDQDLTNLRAQIDRSVRWPVLLFFTSAGFWFLATIILGLMSTWTLLSPDAFGDCPAFKYGRLQSAHTLAMVYGLGFNLAFGVILWMMHRLCRMPMKHSLVPNIAGHLWNIALTIGIFCVFGGIGSGVEWLEFPKQVGPALLVAYIVIALWAFVPFTQRDQPQTFVSLWFLVAALFAFPALFLTANVFIHMAPSAAVVSTAVNYWYIGGVQFLFFLPIAAAAAFYLIPKVSGRPIFSYSLALASFWALILLGGWTGLHRLLGAPLPAWMPAVSGAAGIVILIPALMILVNVHATLGARFRMVNYSATLRFAYASIVALFLAAVLNALGGIPTLSKYAGLTQAVLSTHVAVLLGVFTMAGFGAIYFIVPRLCGCEWPSGRSIRFHFWFTVYSILILVVTLAVGGFWQGNAEFMLYGSWKKIVDAAEPFYIGQLIGWTMLLMANFSFVLNLWVMVFGQGRRAGSPTLLHEVHELDQPMFDDRAKESSSQA